MKIITGNVTIVSFAAPQQPFLFHSATVGLPNDNDPYLLLSFDPVQLPLVSQNNRSLLTIPYTTKPFDRLSRCCVYPCESVV
ncbi:hypothetical protein Hanom_Chr13g01236021 [Helianthus anomalus]